MPRASRSPLRPGRAAALLVVLAIAGTACDATGPKNRGGAHVRPERGGSISFGVVGSPATFDPYSPVASDLTYALVAPIYPSLYRFAPDGSAHPYLAKSRVETSGGVRVTLRKARWSDGRPILASDVVASARRARTPSGFARVGAVRVAGRRTVAFEGPVEDWPRALATLAFVTPRGLSPGGVPTMSGGPMRIASSTRGLNVVYKRNRRWWGPPSYLRSTTVVFVESEDVLLALLEKGRLDAAWPPSSINLEDRLRDLDLGHSARLGWETIRLELSPALSQRERAAVVAGVDRDGLDEGLFRDEGRVTNSLHPGPEDGADRGPWAGAIEPGIRPAGRVTLSAPAGDELLGLLQRAIQIQLGAAGMSLDPVVNEADVFYGPWRVHDPTDVAIVRAAGAPGLGAGGGAFRSVTAVPLAQVETFLAWRRGAHGLVPNPTFDGPLWNVERWWKG